MIITEYNQQWDEEATFNYAFNKGGEEKLFEVVTKLLQIKSPIESIIAVTGWDEKKILQFAKDIQEQRS